MGSTPHALRRGTALAGRRRAADAPLAHDLGFDRRRHPPAHPRDPARRRLAVRARRPVGRLARTHRLDPGDPAPRRRLGDTAADGSEPTPADVAEWLVAPIVTTLQRRRTLARLRAPADARRAAPARSSTSWCGPARSIEGGTVIGCAGLVVDISDRHLVEAEPARADRPLPAPRRPEPRRHRRAPGRPDRLRQRRRRSTSSARARPRR